MSNGDEHSGSNDPYRTMAQMVPGQAILGRYTLTRILGRGGFGVVWEVHDDDLDMDVAIKFLSDIIVSNPEAVDDLKRETKFSLRLTHPNIVRIYGFVQDPTIAGISMEYIDGGTLSALKVKRANRCFDADILAPLTERLCDALDYAHKRVKIAHRDLKPGNLMVDAEGDLKVADFGISRSISDTQTALTKMSSSGTPAFMSPQQMMGEPASHSDDIYSLGGTLYDLLAGKPPFYTGNIVEQVRAVAPVTIAARREELGIEAPPVPPEWEEVIRACLEKEAGDRPSSAAEVANRLGLRISGASAAPVSLDNAAVDEVNLGSLDSRPTPPDSRIPTSSTSKGSALESGGVSAPGGAAHDSESTGSVRDDTSASGSRPSGSEAHGGRPRWMVPAAIGLVGVVAAGSWWFSRPTKGDEVPGPPDPIPTAGHEEIPSTQRAASGPAESTESEAVEQDVTATGSGSADMETLEAPAADVSSEINVGIDDGPDGGSDGGSDGGIDGGPDGGIDERVKNDATKGADVQAEVVDQLAAQIEETYSLVARSVRRGDWDGADSALDSFRQLAPHDGRTSVFEAQIAEGREVQRLRAEIPGLLAANRIEPARTAIAKLLRRRPGDRDGKRWQERLAAQTGTTSGSPGDDRAAIGALLRQYESALESLDFAQFVGLWSDLSKKKRSKFEKAFKGIESQSIELVGAPTVSIEDDKASVNLREKRKMTMSAGRDFDVEVNSVLALVRIDGTWKIADLEAR